MAHNEVKNVLIIGTTGVRTSQFCKLFEAYLSHDTYEEAIQWQPELNSDDGIERPCIYVNNLQLICMPNLEASYISKQIISVLVNFEEKQSLSAIIILIKPNEIDSVYLDKLRRYFFHDLKQFSDNVLYVNAVNDNLYKCEEVMKEHFKMMNRNVFNFNEKSFYNAAATNWSESVKFCKNIKSYINGNENKCGLETIYVDIKISDEFLLNLINNLTELLILIYICINVKAWMDVRWSAILINEFQRNVTVCHGNKCNQTGNVYTQSEKEINMKTPKICHSSCGCTEANKNLIKCKIFDVTNKTCKHCKCKVECHSQNYFKTEIKFHQSINQQQQNQEKQIIINIFARLYCFKKQNQEVLDSEDIFKKYLNLEEADSKIIFNTFKCKLDQKVKELSRKSLTVTNKDVVISLNSLYEIKVGTTIFPRFLEEIFPKEPQFEIVAKIPEASVPNTGIEIKIEPPWCFSPNKKKARVSMNPTRKNVTEKNGNNLNSPSSEDAATASEVNFDQNKENHEEKKQNWNIQ